MARQVWMLLVSFQVLSIATCQQTMLTFTQEEEQPAGQFVGSVSGSQIVTQMVGKDDRPSLRYNILGGDDNFALGNINGNLTFAKRIDREKLCPMAVDCKYPLTVTVSGPNGFFQSLSVQVIITDINDNDPYFSPSVFNLTINEASPPGFSSPLLSANDADMSEAYGVKTYGLEPESEVFRVVTSTNQIGTVRVSLVLSQPLDRETLDRYQLYLVARDGGTPKRSGTLTVNIIVGDDNDNFPVFSSVVYTAVFNETAQAGYEIIRVKATDADLGENGRVVYSLSTIQPGNRVDIRDKIAVNLTTGSLTLKSALPSGDYQIHIDAQDNGSPTKSNQALVNVTVLDTENSQPVVTLNLVQINDYPKGTAPETASAVGSVVAVVTVDDSDSGKNGNVSCASAEPSFQLQQLSSYSYKLMVARPLDRETTAVHNVTIVCQDQGTPSLSASASVQITVIDINDNPPVFPRMNYDAQIIENNMQGDTVLVVNALDADVNENSHIEYRLINEGGNFTISPTNGVIRANRVFDREEQSRYEFKALAVDKGTPPLTGVTTIVITILDVNDNAPKFSQDNYKFQIYENREKDSMVGNLSVVDPDLEEGGEITFTVRPVSYPDDIPFSVTKDGRILTLDRFDRESRSDYKFIVIATDNGQPKLSSSTQVTVDILDMNDNRPSFIFPGPQNSSAYVNIPIEADSTLLSLEVSDLDQEDSQNSWITYSIVASNASDLFRIGKIDGRLIANRAILLADVGTYSITINASDQGNPVMWTTGTVLVVVQTEPVAASSKVLADQNVLIVACIVCFTVIVSGAVLVALCVMRRVDRQRKMQYGSSSCCPSRHQDGEGRDMNRQYDPATPASKQLSTKDISSPFDLHHQPQVYQLKPSRPNDSFQTESSNVSTFTSGLSSVGDAGKNYFTGQTRQLPDVKVLKHDDFHSTSSAETSTGDSGHGSDEDMSNSLEHAIIPTAPPVPAKMPSADLPSYNRQNSSRLSCPQQQRMQRPSLLLNSAKAKTNTVRFDPHVSYDQIPPFRASQVFQHSMSHDNISSVSSFTQQQQQRPPQKFDLLLVQDQQQQAPHHQLQLPSYRQHRPQQPQQTPSQQQQQQKAPPVPPPPFQKEHPLVVSRPTSPTLHHFHWGRRERSEHNHFR
ncbi:protocadherin gamma-B1-like [Physella acuta]|uniref:protocadherin gamma-B1-like n=1 Tax=Physella acuta TaxID=109671 RepID=UPI0027DC04BA|nr:protocadherin gamma-B1-like [Physella acuta]